MLEAGSLFGTRCVGCHRRGPLLCDPCLRTAPPAGELRRPPHVARVVCPWAYEGAARSLILRLKVRGVDAAALPLARGIAAGVHRAGLEAHVVTWVPGRPRDIRRRGFDHAHLLASGVAERLGLECVELLARRGHQDDQAGLNARERARNLRGAFVAAGAADAVVVVDDVMTTGSTLSACAHALRAAGVRRVEAAVAAAA